MDLGPMISIIVPVYKVEPYLRQCVDSILGQTYRDIEVLLIDDGSSDRCGEICDEYARIDNRIRVFHTENRGVASARQTGLLEARGEYIGFVDSDDWIEPEMFRTMLSGIENANADIIVCAFWREHFSSRREHRIRETVYTGKDALRALVEGTISNYLWDKLYHRALLQNILFPIGKLYEDIPVMHQIVGKSNRTVLVQQPLYHYRQRPESITKEYSAKNLIDYADAHLSRYFWFREHEKELFAEKQDELLRFVARGISKVWRWWFGCSKTEKKNNMGKIEELKCISRDYLPLSKSHGWPLFLQISLPFMYSSSYISFLVLYYANGLFRKLFPHKSNTLISNNQEMERC